MMLLFLISATITVFLLVAGVILLLGDEPVDARLMEIAASPLSGTSSMAEESSQSGLAQMATGISSIFKPVRGLITGSDDDLTYRLTLAGFRKPEHVEIYTALKML